MFAEPEDIKQGYVYVHVQRSTGKLEWCEVLSAVEVADMRSVIFELQTFEGNRFKRIQKLGHDLPYLKKMNNYPYLNVRELQPGWFVNVLEARNAVNWEGDQILGDYWSEIITIEQESSPRWCLTLANEDKLKIWESEFLSVIR